MSNKLLLGILVLLLAVYGFYQFSQGKKDERTFRNELVAITAEEVTVMKVTEPEKGTSTFEKDGDQWKIKTTDQVVATINGAFRLGTPGKNISWI